MKEEVTMVTCFTEVCVEVKGLVAEQFVEISVREFANRVFLKFLIVSNFGDYQLISDYAISISDYAISI